MEPRFTAVVGASGRMGSLLVRLLKSAGHSLLPADVRQGEVDWAAVGRAETVILAVPVPAMENVLTALGPHTREDGLVMDLGSLKAEPLRLMMEHCRGEVLGCHPMFGPAIETMAGQTVFLCPGRNGPLTAWWRSFFKQFGARAVDIDPARHDRLMARVQVLRHLMLFSFGLSLEKLGFDIEAELPMAGPWFAHLMEMIGVQLDQGSDLYADLAFGNDEAAPVMEVFAQAAADFSRQVAEKDRDGLTAAINRLDKWFERTGGRRLDTTYNGVYIQKKNHMGGKPCAW